MPVVAVDNVGAKEYRAKTKLLHTALNLGNRVVDVEHRNHTGALELIGIGLAKLVEPIVVSARQGGGELGFHVRNAKGIQSPPRVEYRKVDSFLIHGLQLDLRAPAPFHMRFEELLIAVKYMARWRNRFGRRIHWSAPCSPVRPDHSQISHMIGCATRRVIFELGIDVSLPKIRR